MPQLGETVTEGTVAQWLKKPGESVEKYEAFVEVSTDKVNAEVPAPVSGTIAELLVREGETVKIGTPIAVIEETAAEAAPAPLPAAPLPVRVPAPSPNGQGLRVAAPAAASGGVRVSPAVRRLAREHHIDLALVHGTGANGRITANDIIAAASSTPVAPQLEPLPQPQRAPQPQPGELVALTHARALIAERMVESKRTAPHAWTMVEVDVTNLSAWRNREKDAFESAHGVKLTLLPFFIRACVESLAQFPLMNSSFTSEGIRVHRDVNVGIAIAAEGSLVVPVIRNAEKLSIAGLALAAGTLIEKARTGRLGADDLAGGTFTVNNTGANGSILSAPILVPGQTGIVTMEAAVRRPVVRDDDAIAIRTMMNVCLSLDHRVVDGAVASGFLSDLKRRLQAMGPSGSL
jgi:2-oxoisovalerate dehydrogenase E2 component (dihydrolipoyl transacylase)